MKSSFGLAWSSSSPAHVNVWLETEADGTDKLTVSYNLMDSTGDHPFPKRKPTGKKLAPLWKELCECRDKAIAQAREKRDYAAARSKGPKGGRFEFAYLATWGRGGTTVYFDEKPDGSARLHGYGFSDDELAQIDALGIPFIDSRTIPDDRICNAISLPMAPDKPDRHDAAPWGPLSRCPLDVLAWLYADLGATVRNITPRRPAAEELRG